jgi:hypothetical protein
MKLVPNETCLVVAGAWNPAIVTPEWILRFGLKAEPGLESRVQAFIPTGIGMIFEFPRFSLENFSFVVRPDTLIFYPKELSEQQMTQIEFVAGNTVQELTHTPIRGIGHNFEFRDAEPDLRFLAAFTNSQTDLVDATPEGWTVSASTVTTALQIGESVVNIVRSFDGTQLSVRFNFHHQVTGGEHALELLRNQNGGKRFFDSYNLAREIITKMYGDINDD